EISLKAAYSPAMAWSLLSKTSSTVAWDTGLRAVEPEKMTSVRESPRRRLAERSPITQRTASRMFDLPQPFGPTTPGMFAGRSRTVGSTKDLKAESVIVDRRMGRWVASAGARGGGGLRERGAFAAPEGASAAVERQVAGRAGGHAAGR